MMIQAPTAAPLRQTTDDRRTAIAAAARALIVEKGVEGLRTRDIAERVGINVATLHYHVPTKEALIELVSESLRDAFIQQSIDRPREHLSAGERMELEFVDFHEIAFDRPEILLVFSELMERGRRDERIATSIIPMKHRWRSILASLLTEGVTDGIYRPDIDAEAFAQIMISSMIGFCRNPKKDPASFDRLIAEFRRAMKNPALETPSDLSKPASPPRHSRARPSKE
jgi:AcrR family transcriptional regulator